MRSKVAVIVAATLLSGCSTYAIRRYEFRPGDVSALRSLNGKVLNVGAFTATTPGQKEIRCRGAITTPDGESFADYVRKALLDDLRMANAYSPTAPVTLTGNLDSIAFSSAKSNWDLALTIKSSNGRSMSVHESFASSSFRSFVFGAAACRMIAMDLMPAVQNLIGKVVQSSDFGGLVSP
jgi:hypothetical protein